MRLAVLVAAALVSLGCGERENRAPGSAGSPEVLDGALSLDDSTEPARRPALVPEFRLRLDPGTHTVDARMELDVPEPSPLHLLFRTESEGYPGLEARLQRLEAWGPAGALPVEKVPEGLGPGHYLVEVGRPGRVTVAYKTALTPDGESRHYHRVSQLATDGGHLIGNDLLPRVWLGSPRAGPQPARLWFAGMPSNWRVVTVEPRAGTGYDVEEISSAVFVVGPLRTQRFNIGPRSLTAAIYGRWPVRDERVFNAVNRIAGSLHRIAAGGWVPGDYVLAAGRVPADVPGLSAGGQVIGRSGIVYVGGSGPAELEFRHWMYTTAHELMHWYIPTAFDFEDAPPSWFAEGFTDYMALKILLVGGLIEWREFLDEIGARFARYRASPLHGTSIAEAQEDFWDEHAYRYIYDGGAAAAFLLDLGFQDRGGSLERVLREVGSRDRLTTEDLTTALAAVRENGWIGDWLATGANPDWEARFAPYGLAWRNDTLTSLNDWASDALSSIR
jgi:predicted metalloprotease with PDZ domain